MEDREVSQLFEISLQLFEISLQLFEISAAQIEKKVVPTYEKRKTTSKPNLKTKNQMPKKMENSQTIINTSLKGLQSKLSFLKPRQSLKIPD